jgi:hypothetical protein
VTLPTEMAASPEDPIIDSPFSAPRCHWASDPSGAFTATIEHRRRRSEYLVPIAQLRMPFAERVTETAAASKAGGPTVARSTSWSATAIGGFCGTLEKVRGDIVLAYVNNHGLGFDRRLADAARRERSGGLGLVRCQSARMAASIWSRREA